MYYTVPDYYNEFKCAANKCESTCCAGWQVVIDKKSLKKYNKIRGDFKKILKKSINFKEGTFKMCGGRRCIFLNDENFCDLYINLGKESLCNTCRRYPRHIEEFENIREITLSASCPVVARILLNKKEPAKFLSVEKHGQEEYEDFDLFLYSKLDEGRDVIIKILQDREMSVEMRCYMALAVAHDMERRIKKGKLFECDDVFKIADSDKGKAVIKKKTEKFLKDDKKVYEKAARLFTDFISLEHLQDTWHEKLVDVIDDLYMNGEIFYKNIREEFNSWVNKNIPDYDIMLEQLLVYFMFTYFCGAVYDEKVYAKAKMSIASVFMMNEMIMHKWYSNKKTLSFDNIVTIVYSCSREIEHSDTNLDIMESLNF